MGTVKKLTIFLRLFLPLFAIVDLSQHVARLLLAVLDDVAVDVLRRGDLRVTEHETIIALWEKLQSINKAAKDAGVAYGTARQVLKMAGKIA